MGKGIIDMLKPVDICIDGLTCDLSRDDGKVNNSYASLIRSRSFSTFKSNSSFDFKINFKSHSSFKSDLICW